MKHIFKIGDGMSIENSTAEERKEIGYLFGNFNYADTVFKKYNLIFSIDGWSLSSKKPTNPLTYAQMKALILGDTSKMPFKAAVSAVSDRSHQIQNDCDNFDLLGQLSDEIFQSRLFVSYHNFYFKGSKHNEWSTAVTADYANLPIIKLSEIMPKEEVPEPITHVIDPAVFTTMDALNERLEKSLKLICKINAGLADQKQLISKRDYIRRELKIKPIEGTFQHVGNGTYEVKFDDPKVKSKLNPCALCTYETSSRGENALVQLCDYHNNNEVKITFDIPVEEKPVELEVGKWYKTPANGLYMIKSLISDKKFNCYGFNPDGCWVELPVKLKEAKKDVLATTSEITDALKNEAIKRGLVEGVYFNSLYTGCGVYDCKIIADPFLSDNMSSLWIPVENGRNGEIMNKGIWATPIQTPTLKEAEEKLSVKIID